MGASPHPPLLQKTLVAAEKQYYEESLIMNKDNMNKSWRV